MATTRQCESLGQGALLNIKIDRLSVPYTNIMVATEKLAASGLPVHIHTWEDEVIYVVKGQGFAVINEDRWNCSKKRSPTRPVWRSFGMQPTPV